MADSPQNPWFNPTRWLPAALVLLACVALPKPPVIDEESYLWLGTHGSFADPYAWSRAWQGHDGWVYAHPPLFLWWMHLWAFLSGPAAIRLVAGVPFVALYGWAAALWARRVTHHPGYAAAAILGSTTVVLGVQDSLMIDLPYVALLTFGLAAYREALESKKNPWFALSGLGIGLAIETKYPAALVVPVLLASPVRLPPWTFWAPLLGIVAGAEGYLALGHGEFHPWAAWTHRDRIGHGPLDSRTLGVLARMSLLPLTASLLFTRPMHVAVGTGLAVLALAWARPSELSGGEVALLLLCAALGGTALSRSVAATLSPSGRARKGDKGDSRMLGGTVIAVVGGVLFLHNYASARYLWAAAAPVAILAARSAEEVAEGKRALLITSVAGGFLALSLALADWKFGAAQMAVARTVLSENRGTTTFVGEWSFRRAMEQAGWTSQETVTHPSGSAPETGGKPTESPETASQPSGTASETGSDPAAALVVVDDQSGGHVPSTWEPLEHFPSHDRFPLRVVDVKHGAGLYSETLGPLPFTVADGPIAGATLYRVPRE